MTGTIEVKRELGFAVKAYFHPAQCKHCLQVSHFDGTTVREATGYVLEKELRGTKSREAIFSALYANLFRELAFTINNAKVL